MLLRRTLDMVFACGFALIVALPLFTFSSDQWDIQAENRLPASLPPSPANEAQLRAYPTAFEHYFNDHFGLRSTLTGLHNTIDFWVFRRSASDDVTMGKHGWFFFAGDLSTENYRGTRVLSADELEAWRYALEARRDRLRAHGSAYLFVIAPDKQSIYPEEMPKTIFHAPHTQIDQLVSYLTRYGDENLVLDLRSALIAAKGTLPVYQRLDSHWTDFGAYIGYRAISNHLGRLNVGGMRVLDLLPEKFQISDEVGGELPAMAGDKHYSVRQSNAVYSVGDLDCSPPTEVRPIDHLATNARTQDMVTTCQKEGNDARAVIFHDSFMAKLRPFLSQSAAYARFSWRRPTLEDIEAYVEAEHPTVVIEERVERTLQVGPDR